ncbi:glycosidase-like protein [Altererythrobacter marinus]|uniref:Glycosidase-like protein n=1 Tax=Pelagerythrobacter marinus TaxID=538382 RepID=A0ABW9URN9_9SPHN|nr:glycosidase-like protein [Pelagerythrobacter marinus]MXO67255.1 glycosidase-like protein [Pelagerythrobacter marinus]
MKTGVNMIETASAHFGSGAARASFERLARAGARVVALVPFFWQSHPGDPALVRGSALPAERLRLGMAEAARVGLEIVVKPHVWVPGNWAGSIAFDREEAWRQWFAAYERALLDCADTAREGGAQVLSVGTELAQTSARAEWHDMIARVREAFPGRLTYVAHNAQEAQRIGFWDRLDIVALSAYPALGRPTQRQAWRRAMTAQVGALRSLAERHGKAAWLGEIGLRSAEGATARPWESAEERAAAPDPALQRDVLRLWLDVARGGGIETALVWRWLSDPAGGGPADTDFTIQNKPAQGLLAGR